MPTIRQLSPSIINKIAAGEVIERPASVVKELLENSIDAGATRIELAIESGGLDLMRISDNGCGIASDELPLAVASHATSKLVTADDLFDVHSLGFRGEALASIAEISHLVLRSRVASEEAGAELQVRGGAAEPIVPVGMAVGTVIEVRHLFFNTPVRRKFLRAPQTEASHVVEAFTRIALAYPHVHMTLQSGTRQLFDLPSTHNIVERIAKFFGNEIADALISVESESDGIRLHGFVTDPAVSRSNNRMQYLFLNGRHIRDRSLQHALGEAYRGLLMVGRFPVCFLRLEMPPQLVDVNVHPTTLEVRFQDGGKIYSQLLQTLRHRFLSTDLTARVRMGDRGAPQPTGVDAAYGPPVSRDDARWEAHAQRVTAGLGANPPAAAGWPGQAERSGAAGATTARLPLTHSVPEFRPFPAASPLGGLAAAGQSPALPEGATMWNGDLSSDAAALFPTDEAASPASSTAPTQAGRAPLPTTQEEEIVRGEPGHAQGPVASHLGFQIHNRYLVTQDDHGMVVVDQHALHERILYEQLRTKLEQGKLESQQLLVPEPLDLTPAEAAAALDSRELLSRIGIEVEPFGGDTVLMTSYPAMLANMRPAEMLRQVLQPLMEGGKEPSARDLLDDLLNMIACKAAIKAGDRLTPDEITSLLEQRYHYQDTHHCPHGRPTALFFSREQLDKLFKRT
ncbi:MAG: DNA mismatch repair endonuclease MutL [Aureliella sp.]